MADYSRNVKVSKKELEEAAKSPEAAALLTSKYKENLKDPVKTSLFVAKDLENYQEYRKALKRKAEAKAWEPAKRTPGKPNLEPEFNGTIGRFAKKGV